MKPDEIIYKTKTASENEIISHLKDCDGNFIPALSERVNIEEYAHKIFVKSVTFEAWKDKLLVGFIATYFNHKFDDSGFITYVGVANDFMGLGIASRLMELCIEHARLNDFTELKLEVNRHSDKAIRLYERFGFVNYKTDKDVLSMRLEISKHR